MIVVLIVLIITIILVLGIFLIAMFLAEEGDGTGSRIFLIATFLMVLGFFAVPVAELGYKHGQKDALRGKFHYEMTFEVDNEGNVIDTNFVEID